jgi:hypothetical protein
MKNFFKKIFDKKYCHNKKHYGADIKSIDPPISICTTCGKEVIIKQRNLQNKDTI